MNLSIIVAMDNNGLIGKSNSLPWHLPADLQYFKQQTTNKTVVMGRKTYESIGKPLPNRRNVIISRNLNFKAQNCLVIHSISDVLELAKKEGNEVMIIGGASFYKQILPNVGRLYITKVQGKHQGDTYFPKFNKSKYKKISHQEHPKNKKNPYAYCFEVWTGCLSKLDHLQQTRPSTVLNRTTTTY